MLKDGELLFKLRLTADAAAAAFAGRKSPASDRTPTRVTKKPAKASTTTSKGTYGSLPIDLVKSLKWTKETAECMRMASPSPTTTLQIGFTFRGREIIFVCLVFLGCVRGVW